MGIVSIGGLASGIDTNSIIQKIMAAESTVVSTQNAKRSVLSNKQAAWDRVRTSLQALRTSLDALRQTPVYLARTATPADSTIVTATASSGANIATHNLTVTSLAQANVVAGSSNAATADTALGLSATIQVGTGTNPANLKAIAITATDTLNTIRSKINTAGANVTADIVPVVNGATTSFQMTLTSTLKGTANAIQMVDDPTTPILQSASLQFKTAGGGWTNQVAAATDAVFTLDGTQNTMATNDITNTLPGVSFSLKKAGTTTITVSQDPSQAVAAVQNWVSALNNTLSTLNNETKSDPKNNQVGALSGDYLARGIKRSVQSMLSNIVAGLPAATNQLSQIGVTTGAWGTANYGQVVLDTAKLTNQLTVDPTSVERLFGAVTDINTTGIAKDMFSYVDSLLTFQTGALDNRGSMLTAQMKIIDGQIGRLQSSLTTREAALREQFGRMEQVIASLRSQGNAFASQFGTTTM